MSETKFYPHYRAWFGGLSAMEIHDEAKAAIVVSALASHAEEIWRLRRALDKIAETTGSDDPCRNLVQIARDVLSMPTVAGIPK